MAKQTRKSRDAAEAALSAVEEALSLGSLGGDDPTDFNSANGAGRMLVDEAGTSDFDIFEVTETIVNDTRNNDPVDASPNDAAFDNLAAPPQLPTVP